MYNDICVFMIESADYSRVEQLGKINREKWDNFLKQIAILRWGYDEKKLNSQINYLKNDPFEFTSFYSFAVKDEKSLIILES